MQTSLCDLPFVMKCACRLDSRKIEKSDLLTPRQISAYLEEEIKKKKTLEIHFHPNLHLSTDEYVSVRGHQSMCKLAADIQSILESSDLHTSGNAWMLLRVPVWQDTHTRAHESTLHDCQCVCVAFASTLLFCRKPHTTRHTPHGMNPGRSAVSDRLEVRHFIFSLAFSR